MRLRELSGFPSFLDFLAMIYLNVSPNIFSFFSLSVPRRTVYSSLTFRSNLVIILEARAHSISLYMILSLHIRLYIHNEENDSRNYFSLRRFEIESVPRIPAFTSFLDFLPMIYLNVSLNIFFFPLLVLRHTLCL